MAGLVQLYLNPLLVFVFVLTRVGGLLMTASVFGLRNVPLQLRVLLAMGISLVITPVYWDVQVADPGNVVNLAVLLAREAALGLSIGIAITILFAGLQVAGQIIGQLSGMSLADVFDPSFDASVPIFAQFLDLLMVAVFLLIGGHRQLMIALLDTFQWMPPGQAIVSADVGPALSEILAQSFSVGLRVAAPVMVSLLISVLVMGLISRTLPQLNVLAVGFSFNSMIMLVTLLLSLGVITRVFQQQAVAAVQHIGAALVADRISPES